MRTNSNSRFSRRHGRGLNLRKNERKTYDKSQIQYNNFKKYDHYAYE